MDRRKLRRLLASSSFAALLVAAEQVRGQSLTNPAGVTADFLQVTAGDTFDNVLNLGVLTGGALDVGIDIEGGTVNGDVANVGTITLSDNVKATGIRMHGASGLVGDDIINQGLIDIAVAGSGSNLLARGIAVEGTNNEIASKDGGFALINDEDATIRVNLRVADTNTAAGTVTAKAGGTAQGLFVGTDVTLSGDVLNDGLIRVSVDNDANAKSVGGAAGKASAQARGEVLGALIVAKTLDGGFANEGDLFVTLDNDAEAVVTAVGFAAKAIADAAVLGSAVGAAFSGNVTGELFHDGTIWVEGRQSATALAKATGSGLAEASAAVRGDLAAVGLRFDGTSLGGGFEGNGIVDVFASQVVRATAVADGVAAAAKVSALGSGATDAAVLAVGIAFDKASIVGGFVNDGAINATARLLAAGTAQGLRAKADGAGGVAAANALWNSAQVDAIGIALDGPTLGGGFANHGAVVAKATGDLLASANAAVSNNFAVALVAFKSVSVTALGIALGHGTIGGDVLNDGAITASAVLSLEGRATAKATKNVAVVTAATAAGVNVVAVGIDFDPNTLNGDFTNQGRIDVSARLNGAGAKGLFAAGIGEAASVSAGWASASVAARAGFLSFNTINGDFRNEGSLEATATGAFQVSADADASIGVAVAKAEFAAAVVSADGLELDFNTIDGDARNDGNIHVDAKATVLVKADALSTKANAIANAAIPGPSGLGVFATGYALSFNTVFGTVSNAGSIVAHATINAAGSDGVVAIADGETKAMANATWHSLQVNAIGIDAGFNRITADLANSGAISARAKANIHVDGLANANTGFAGANAKLSSVTVGATGFGATFDTVDGNLENSGKIVAGASLTLLVDAVASSTKADAIANASIATFFGVTAKAVGLSAIFNTVNGSVSNSGAVQATAKIDGAGEEGVRAFAIGGTQAVANALWNTAEASAVALDFDSFNTIFGNFTNSGDLLANATLLLEANAQAGGDFNADSAFAKALVSNAGARASGLDLLANRIVGDLSNSGDIFAQARIELSGIANAVATSNIATAKAVGAAGGKEGAFGVGMNVSLNTLDGDLLNGGGISAIALVGGGTSGLKAAASGKTFAIAQATWSSAAATGIGMLVSIDSLLGDMTNSGTVRAKADIDLDANAVGEVGAGGTAIGSALVRNAGAFAYGISVGAGKIDGAFHNEGAIFATAAADVLADASMGGGELGVALATVPDGKGAHIQARGLGVAASSLAAFDNSGAIQAIADLDAFGTNGGLLADALATAAGGLAFASALWASAAVSATAIAFAAKTVLGDLTNAAGLIAQADAQISAVALAAGDSALPAVRLEDIRVQAHGLAVTVSSLAGSVGNGGGVAAQAGATLFGKAEANGEGFAFAVASVPPTSGVSVHATGIGLSFSSIGGSVQNDGNIEAAAVVAAAPTTGGLQAGLFAKAVATTAAGGATGSASWASLAVSATGIRLSGPTIAGDVINNGGIAAAALIDVLVSAKATAPASARANAVLRTVTGVAHGLGATFGGVGGLVTNSGAMTVNAILTADVKAFAVGSAAAGAKATASHIFAEAVGFSVGFTEDGGVVNSGNLSVFAKVDIGVTADAAGATAGADVLGQTLHAAATGLRLTSHGSASRGAVNNAALVQATASVLVNLLADGQGGTSAVANASGLNGVAYGLRLEGVGTLNGGFVNNGGAVVRAEADVDATVRALADATDPASASLPGLIGTANAMAAFSLPSLGGGMINHGTLFALATVDARATAQGGTNAALARATATARGMYIKDHIGGTTVTGGLLNDGIVVAIANAQATAIAGTLAVPDGTATAKAAARAIGIEVGVNHLVGDVRNDGFVQAKAFALAEAVGTAGAGASAKATAIGVFARVFGPGDIASGSVINAGTVIVSATANAPALAVGQMISSSGIWIGALANASEGFMDVFASDPAKASAIGLSIDGMAIVQGGVVNAGVIQVEAVASAGNAVARAIDLTKAVGAGHRIQMQDGLLSAITRTTALAASEVGTAVAMHINGKSDTLDWSGGLIEANIIGEKSQDRMNVIAGKADRFNHEFLIDGLFALNVNTAGQAATPVEFRIGGIAQNIEDLNVNENGTLVVGREASISPDQYNQDVDGTVIFEIGAGSGNNGVITIGGFAAVLDGAIGIRPEAGLYGDTQTHLVIVGALIPPNDGFDTAFSNSPLLSLTLADVEDASPDVRLTVRRNAFASVPGLTENQSELGEAIDDFYDPVALAGTELGEEVIAELFALTTDELLDAYDDLHGAEHAQMAYAGFQAMEFLLGGVNQRLHDGRSVSSGGGQSASLGNQSLQYAQIRSGDEGVAGTQLAAVGNTADQPGSVWGKGFGSFGSLDGDDEAPGYDRTTGAIVVGVDYRIDEQFLIGLAGAYAFSSIDFDDGDDGDIDSWQIGLFGSWDSGTWYVDGLVSYAFQSYETTRHIDFIDEKAEGDYDGGAVQVYGEVGYQFQVGQQGLITPLVGLGWTNVWTDDFTETGAGGANLRVDEARYESLATTLGIRGSLALDGWEPSLFLGWRHEFLDDHGEADVAFAAVPGSEWKVIGSDIGSDAGLVGVGLVAEISQQLEATIDYGGQFSGSGSNHTGSIGLRLKF